MWKVFIFAVAFFLGSGLAAWPTGAYAADFPIHNNWMKNLDDNALLTTLSIPGTHDSGADHDHCDEDTSCKDNILMVSTQTYPISDQMTMGIRFFDVRVHDDDGALSIHHGPYFLSQYLSDVINDAQLFLSENPSEFVFYLIDQEDSSVSATDFWAEITKLFSSYPQDLFYLDRSIPTVGQVRGKIVVAARDCQTTYPQGYCIDWSNNSPYSQTKDGDLIYVAEDHYSLNTIDNNQKYAEVRQLLGLARICSGCRSNNTLYFTFLSGEGDASGKYPKHYAGYQNPNTADYLWNSAHNGPRSGIIAMDYAGNSTYSSGELIDHIIAQNKAISIPGWFGEESEGGGMAAADINGNGKPDLVVMNIDNPSGQNGGYYRIGWDLDESGSASEWSTHYTIPWQGWEQQGGGITATDINGDGIPDLIVFMIDNPAGDNHGYYRVGYLNQDGTVSQWTDFKENPDWFGEESEGGGIASADINNNGRPEVILFDIWQSPDGQPQGHYRIGWDLDKDGNAASWLGPQPIVLQGSEAQGGGITARDMNGDGTPDLIVFDVDNSSGINHGYYRIGYLEKSGTVSQWTDFQPMLTWFSSAVQGGGIAVADINGNSNPDLAVFNIDHSASGNYGYYRVIYDIKN